MADIFSLLFPFLRVILWGWASLIGFSRIYLGVHYPLDVVAGMILGVVSAQIGLAIIF